MAGNENTRGAFHQRIYALINAVCVATNFVTPMAIHWTQSNQLFEADVFHEYAEHSIPGPLTVHPMLFGEEGAVGLRTFGAEHWLGREIRVSPSPVSWQSAYQSALDFVATIASEEDYPIAHGDTFSPSEEGDIWQVLDSEAHSPIVSITAIDNCNSASAPANDSAAPFYELILLQQEASEFAAPGENGEAFDASRPALQLIADNTGCECPANPIPADEGVTSREESAEAEGALANSCFDTLDPAELDQPYGSPEAPSEACDDGALHQSSSPPAQSPSEGAHLSGRSLRARVFGNPDT
jgi:hypothetical protein